LPTVLRTLSGMMLRGTRCGVRLAAALLISGFALPLSVTLEHNSSAFAKSHSNGGGNGGGNGNGNGGGNGNGNGNGGGNGNGNGGGNGNASGKDNGNAGKAPTAKPGIAPTKTVSPKIIAQSLQQVERLDQAYKNYLALARKTQSALRLTLLDTDSSVAAVEDLKKLIRMSPQNKALLNLLKEQEDLLNRSDTALAAAYENHLKAVALVNESGKLLERARARHKRLTRPAQ
jgi:hypothetical protein